MEQSYDQLLEDYSSSFGMKIEKGPFSIDYIMETPEGRCRTSIYEVLPFLHLIYFDVHALSLPGDDTGMEEAMVRPVQLNYCLSGKAELMLHDETYLYMNPGDFSISRQASRGNNDFPLKFYQGIAIYFEEGFSGAANQAFLEPFLLDPRRLQERYLSRSSTYLGVASAEIRSIMEKLWKLQSVPEIFQKKLCILELLHAILSQQHPCEEKAAVYYTGTQVDLAKRAEQILTADLSRHIPIRTIAEQFGVSETSLKNYFRGVFGQNISVYLREIRLKAGETLLRTTDLSVAEISFRVGYTKQGKFAELFRHRFGQSPLDYRRGCRLSSTPSDS